MSTYRGDQLVVGPRAKHCTIFKHMPFQNKILFIVFNFKLIILRRIYYSYNCENFIEISQVESID